MPPRKTVEQWAQDDREGFFWLHWRARYIGAMRINDKCMDDLNDASGDLVKDKNGKVTVNSANVSRLREKLSHNRWLMSKLMPETFSEKVQAQISGPGGGPLQVQSVPVDLSLLSPQELRALEAMLERASAPDSR